MSERLERLEALAEQAEQERRELREFFQATMQVLADMSERHEARMAQNEARMAQHETRIEQHQARMAKLDQAILASQVLQGALAEQTLQLKNAVDYLMSQDGGSGSS